MSRGIRNGDYVKVEWVDSAAMGLWREVDEAEQLTLMECTTVGFLINRDSVAIRITQTLSTNEIAIHTIAIPKVCVKSITRLIEAE